MIAEHGIIKLVISMESPSSSSDAKKRLMLSWGMIVVYVLGLVWVLCHPIVSVATGQMKCRGHFIDENSLLSGSLDYDTRIGTKKHNTSNNDGVGLCSALTTNSISFKNNVKCIRHSTAGFDVARIVPSSFPTESVEAIALLVNFGDTNHKNDISSHLDNLLLNMIWSLSKSTESPWLAKTIFVVSPSAPSSMSMHDLAARFNDAVTNTATTNTNTMAAALPPAFFHHALRNVIVFYAHTIEDNNNNDNILILPQGTKGVLPNLDMVFAMKQAFSGRRGNKVHFTPYYDKEQRFLQKIHSVFPTKLSRSHSNYATDLVGMLSFMATMVLGPFPPHAPFLDRGVDSVTVRFPLHNDDLVTYAVQQLSLTIRMLSGLHETLHHSVTQYLLPSRDKFVSNGEYIYPAVLLLLPMALRAVLIVILQDGGSVGGDGGATFFRWREVSALAAICWGGVSLPLWTLHPSDSEHKDTVYMMLYTTALVLLYYVMVVRPRSKMETTAVSCTQQQQQQHFTLRSDTAKSVQCFAALLSVYLHVPLALAHVSLAVPSALLWSPLLAFPQYYKKRGNGSTMFVLLVRRLCYLTLWTVTWPPVGLVKVFGGQYTVYLTWVYTPLHLMFGTLCLLICSS